MVRSTSTAGVAGFDLGVPKHGDDGEARLPIAEWLRARPDISDAATIVARLAAARRQPSRRPARSKSTLATRTLPCDPAAANHPDRPAEPAPELRVPVRPAPADARLTSRRAVSRGAAALVAGAALATGLAIHIGASTTGATAPAAEFGEVVVSSHPSGAAVRLAGVEQGTTPLVLRLATGRYRLEIVGSGGAVQPVDTEVIAGRSASHHVELLAPTSTSGDGVLIVDTGDPVAQLSIDGTPAGATPLASTRVTPGQHTVRVRYRSGATVERAVIVLAGETVSLVLDQPTRRPSPTPVATRVAAGKVADVVVDTPRVPVAINAQPWAQVIVDGRAHGDTPIADLMLTVGDHRVVLRHPELGERVQTVTVRAAGINRVSADLRR